MKKTILTTIIVNAICAITFAQNVNIPDANFKAYLVGNSSINTNSDTEIQVSEASVFTGTINCQNMSIADLTGIEAFTSLTILLCGNNPLGTIDVSQNTALKTFQPYNNNLNTVDVTANTKLSNFVCFGNNFTTLDLSQNDSLYLFVCRKNNLTSLDLSNNSVLGVVICDSNSLSSLDFSNNSELNNLNCSNNNLTSLNLSNVDPVNCALDATSNPNLTCIEVDDVTIATTNWTNIDAGASFSADCTGLSVNEQEMEITLHPNPATNTLYVSGIIGNERYRIFNLSGQLLQEGVLIANDKIKIETLSAGVYFLKLQNTGVTRFVKE